MPDWRLRTRTGRVVYDRPVHLFSSTDVLRIWTGWLNPQTQVGEAELTLTTWRAWFLSAQAIRDRMFPWVRWIREFIRKALQSLIEGLSFQDAQDALDMSYELQALATRLHDNAIAYGAVETSPDAVAAIQEFIKEEL